jgi:ubiquinone/menaquinone biosynthesis C-methylase UbiE
MTAAVRFATGPAGSGPASAQVAAPVPAMRLTTAHPGGRRLKADMAADLGEEDAARAARTYTAAADHYLSPALGFWDRFGAVTVRRLGLLPGDELLDLCCGAGGSAIPAARAVTSIGHVVAVDVAAPLLDAARGRAAAEGLTNIEFRVCDARRTELPDRSFDAVICVFGVFFASDMAGFVTEMWRMVRPGGRLAITTWGPGLFEPADTLFWQAVRELSPQLYKGFHPWDQLTTPDLLAGLFARAGIDEANVDLVRGEHHLDAPDDFWQIVLGSGYRATLDALEREQRMALRTRLLDRLRDESVTVLRTDVVYGLASRA